MVNEIAEEGRKRQGHDVLCYILNVVCIKFDVIFQLCNSNIDYGLVIDIYCTWQWEIQLASYTKEVERSEAKYVSYFNEYIETKSVSIELGTFVLISALFPGECLTKNVLFKIYHRSIFLHLMDLTGPLVNGKKTYQVLLKTRQQNL